VVNPRGVPYDDQRSGTFEPLRHVPEDRVVVLGLVSTKKPRLETEGELKGRIVEDRVSCRSNGSRSARNVGWRPRPKATACPPTISGPNLKS
jgi:hypothetical protein